jgi:hypothetical protein
MKGRCRPKGHDFQNKVIHMFPDLTDLTMAIAPASTREESHMTRESIPRSPGGLPA